MKQTYIGVAAMLSLVGMSAHASCADPRMIGKQTFPAISPLVLQDSTNGGAAKTKNASAADDIVGTWYVNYTVEGSVFGQAFIQWHSDGTEWENIDMPIMNGNLCMGSWKSLDASHVFRHHIGWLYTDGLVTGYFTETETDEVASDGNSYVGSNAQKVYDTHGVLQFEVTGTASARRFWP